MPARDARTSKIQISAMPLQEYLLCNRPLIKTKTWYKQLPGSKTFFYGY
jgi:hypothetical protein